MIERLPLRSNPIGGTALDPESRDHFANPWAECWGDAAAPGGPQMSAASGEPAVGGAEDKPCAETVEPSEPGALRRVLPIINQRGLHARASAKFVQTVERFDAEIKVSRCGETVGGLSIMGLMMLAAARGTTISVEASGPQAGEALDALEALVADRVGEDV